MREGEFGNRKNGMLILRIEEIEISAKWEN